MKPTLREMIRVALETLTDEQRRLSYLCLHDKPHDHDEYRIVQAAVKILDTLYAHSLSKEEHPRG